MLRFALLFSVPVLVAASILNSLVVDESKFRVTSFATGQAFVSGVIQAPDQSMLALISPNYTTAQVLRYTDTNQDGLADGPPALLYSNSLGGPATQIRKGNELLYIGEYGARAITAVRPGVSAGDPLSAVGSLEFQYSPYYAHPTVGMAIRQTPGTPGSVDLVFNVGAEFNSQPSISPVTLSGFGLAPITLQGDALYMLTVDETGPTPLASNLRTVATGIRNVYGMTFHPVTGDLYIADNAINESPITPTSEPVQADEINRIAAADLGVNAPNFGYPYCYPQYRTGTLIEVTSGACSGITQSLIQFQPLPDGPAAKRTEGPTEIAFAPIGFPAEYLGGLFVGFAGTPEGFNDQNGVVFVNSGFNQLSHFVESATPSLEMVLGVYGTQDSLFLSNFDSGTIFQIQALSAVPEPGSYGLIGVGLVTMAGIRRMASRRTRGD